MNDSLFGLSTSSKDLGLGLGRRCNFNLLELEYIVSMLCCAYAHFVSSYVEIDILLNVNVSHRIH